MPDHFTDEEVEALKAGLEGVTPGPWVYDSERDTHDSAIHQDIPLPSYSDGTPMAYYPADKGCVVGSSEWIWLTELDGMHIARCSPDAIRRLLARLEQAEARVGELETHREEHEAMFDLRWNADMRAIKRWREANPGNDLALPDHADLVVWLLERGEVFRSALRPFAAFAEKARRFVQGRVDFGGSPIMPTKAFRLADFEAAESALKEPKP